MAAVLFNKFPPKAKKLWESVYRNARVNGKNVQNSTNLAMSVIKNTYKKQKGVWVKKHLNIKLHLIKHGLIFPSYKFELELSNNKWDSDNQMISEDLLNRIVDEGNIAMFGDVDHEKYYQTHNSLSERDLLNTDKGTEGLYYLDSYKFEEGGIKAIIGMNKKHPLFNKYLTHHHNGDYLYASAEFPNAEIENGVVINADKMLWSITNNPAGDVIKGVIAE